MEVKMLVNFRDQRIDASTLWQLTPARTMPTAPACSQAKPCALVRGNSSSISSWQVWRVQRVIKHIICIFILGKIHSTCQLKHNEIINCVPLIKTQKLIMTSMQMWKLIFALYFFRCN